MSVIFWLSKRVWNIDHSILYGKVCVANLGNWSILVYIFCITRTTQILKLSNLQKRLFSPNFKAKFCSRKCWTQNYSNRMIFSEWMNSVNLKFTMFNTSIELNIKVVSITKSCSITIHLCTSHVAKKRFHFPEI